MSELYLDGVKKYMDATLILKNITFMVNEGERVGIVGENGSGKTTILKMKEESLRIQEGNYKEQQKQISSMEKSVKELREWAMRSDNNKFYQRAASIQIKLDKLERIEKPVMERKNMKLNVKMTQRSGNITMKAVGLYKSFENRSIFKDAGLILNYGERVALIGPNGCGKTTFLRMLLGELRPDNGEVSFGANVLPAYLPQNISFQNEELTILECFREDKFIEEGKARDYLAKFMFHGKNVFKKVKHLSGGERVRLKLSRLLFEDINLLILDEPTNHLDTFSIETIEKALKSFKGTIFFISHDRYFINKIGERVIAIEDNNFRSYPGNYDAYKSIKDEMLQQEMENKENKQHKASGSGNVPGHNDGNKKGKQDGFNKGKQDGNDKGRQEGYNKRKQDSSDKRKQEGNDKRKQDGYNKGMQNGDDKRKQDGYNKGMQNDDDKRKQEDNDKGKQVDNNKKRQMVNYVKLPAAGISRIPEAVDLEEFIGKLEEEIKEMEDILAGTEWSYEEADKLFLRKEELNRQLEAAMEIWVNLEE